MFTFWTSAQYERETGSAEDYWRSAALRKYTGGIALADSNPVLRTDSSTHGHRYRTIFTLEKNQLLACVRLCNLNGQQANGRPDARWSAVEMEIETELATTLVFRHLRIRKTQCNACGQTLYRMTDFSWTSPKLGIALNPLLYFST